MKTIVAIMLCLALLSPARADDMSLAQGCIALIVGGIVCIGLNTLCDRALRPPSETPPPPATNAPPANPGNDKPTFHLRWWAGRSQQQPGQAFDISSFGWMDTHGRPTPYYAGWCIELQSTTNFLTWATDVVIRGYASTNGFFFAFYTNGIAMASSYSPRSAGTNNVNLNLWDGPQRFFRAVERN